MNNSIKLTARQQQILELVQRAIRTTGGKGKQGQNGKGTHGKPQ